jgi:hypothetical protein
MGFQLPGPTKGKVEHLIAKYGAERLAKPPKAFHGIPEGKALVCVVDSVTYETAHYCFSAAEMAQLNDATDFKSRTCGCSCTETEWSGCRAFGRHPKLGRNARLVCSRCGSRGHRRGGERNRAA